MGFLSPWFLAGIAAVGIPLYLHLLRRHSTTPRPFSSLMFFEPRTQSSIKHRRLRYLLLLSFRLALLLLLALAFADPFVTRPAAAVSGDKLLLVVLDNSFSMRAGSRLADARREALSLLAARPPLERAQVMAFGAQLQALTRPVQDTGALRSAVESLQPGDDRASLSELGRAVRSLAENVRTPIEMHFISDMQATGMPANFSEIALPENVSLFLHPVVKTPAPNWTVESVTAPGQVFEPKKTRIQAVVAGYNTPQAARAVSLIVNGKTVATQTAQVPAGGRVTVEFRSFDLPYGFSRCAVRIDSADALPADDSSIFAIERSDPAKVLFVHDSADTRSPLYFGSALSSAANSVFTVQNATVEQAANLDPSKYALVVLSDVFLLPSPLENNLSRYVRGGGGLFILAGTAAGHRPRIPVLGNRILGSDRSSGGDNGYLAAGPFDRSHPSLNHAGEWTGVKFFYAVRVDPGDSRVVARLSDGTPLLLDEKMGEGRAMLLTSGLDNLTNDLPLHAAFVPFAEQISRYLSGAGQRSGSRTVGSFLELRTAREQAIGVEVVDPDGRRPLSLSEASTAQSYQLMRAGFYQLRLANGRQELVGVNPDPRESDLGVIPDDVLTLWRGDPSTPAPTAAPAAQEQQQQERRQLWWYVMILVLAAAIAESVLASRYLGTQTEEP